MTDPRYPGTAREQLERRVRMQHEAADPSFPRPPRLPRIDESSHGPHPSRIKRWHEVVAALVFFAGLVVTTVLWFDSRASKADLKIQADIQTVAYDGLAKQLSAQDKELAVLKQAFADQVETNKRVLEIMQGWNNTAADHGKPTPFPFKGLRAPTP